MFCSPAKPAVTKVRIGGPFYEVKKPVWLLRPVFWCPASVRPWGWNQAMLSGAQAEVWRAALPSKLA